MLRALLFDLDGTLVQGDAVLAHVPDALAALAALHAGPDPLALALVSNDAMVDDGDRAVVARVVADYVARVAALGLLAYFTPPARHVTLSTEVGVRKPDAAIFRAALSRLELPPDLATAMFVTKDAAHVAAVRAWGMTAWQLGGDFLDWSVVPLLVAEAIGESDPVRLRAALALRVRAVFAERVASVERVDRSTRLVFATLAADSPEAVVLTLDVRGDVVAIEHVEESVRERKFREALDDNAAISSPGSELEPGQTHAPESSPGGTRPRRKRYSIT